MLIAEIYKEHKNSIHFSELLRDVAVGARHMLMCGWQKLQKRKSEPLEANMGYE